MEEFGEFFEDFSVDFAVLGFFGGIYDDFLVGGLLDFEFGAVGFNKDGEDNTGVGLFYAHGVMHSDSQGASVFLCSMAQLNLLRRVLG